MVPPKGSIIASCKLKKVRCNGLNICTLLACQEPTASPAVVPRTSTFLQQLVIGFRFCHLEEVLDVYATSQDLARHERCEHCPHPSDFAQHVVVGALVSEQGACKTKANIDTVPTVLMARIQASVRNVLLICTTD